MSKGQDQLKERAVIFFDGVDVRDDDFIEVRVNGATKFGSVVGVHDDRLLIYTSDMEYFPVKHGSLVYNFGREPQDGYDALLSISDRQLIEKWRSSRG